MSRTMSTTRAWTRRIAVGLTSAAMASLIATAPAAAHSPAASGRSSAPAFDFVNDYLDSEWFGWTPQLKTIDWPDVLADCSSKSYRGDKRLGPATLPKVGLVGLELIGYHRTGDLPTAAFLAQYYDATLNGGTGGWIYPPQNGYRLDQAGRPIQWEQTLPVGLPIDRFGSEYGGFLSPTGLPYFTRAIPPTNLNSTPAASCNYHHYRVTKPFGVDAGPIAPWFAQPGGGLQFQLDPTLVPDAPTPVNVLWLVDHGYLKRLP